MRDLLRFFLRQRDNILFLFLLLFSLSLVVNGNMHQRAQVISSSRSAVGNVYQWRSELTEFAGLRTVNKALAEALALEREKHLVGAPADSGTVVVDSVRSTLFRFRTARVINTSVHKERNYLTLDRGSNDGILADQGVVGAHGIVGVVRESSPRFAVVVSVLNHEFSTSIKLAKSGHFGLYKWNTHDPTTASMLDVAKHVPVAVGDTVVTRGDGIFPADVPVGVVELVENDPGSNFHHIRFRLSEDMTRTGYVQVTEDLHRAERDSLEAKFPTR